ncbi:hypothetical protein ACG94X_16630 [Acinetobacter sp. ULE_I010]|uniref:hypothetical protein n=1 Tax=Acinetobacter sp. ULE_I010 TaxID=3373065 RepID=UPI003AF7BEEA
MSQVLNDLAQEWREHYIKLTDTVGTSNLLDPKLVTLIHLIIDVTATHLYAPGVQKNIQEALKIGLSRSEIMEVFKLASIVGIHACALGVPLLEAELDKLNLKNQDDSEPVDTPVCDELRAEGSFNPLWATLYRWEPAYLEDFLKMAMQVWRNNILPPLWVEFLCIAGDATITHMWAAGTQRHMQAALALGATKAQIMEVLKILSLQGMEAFEVGIPILAQALETSIDHS